MSQEANPRIACGGEVHTSGRIGGMRFVRGHLWSSRGRCLVIGSVSTWQAAMSPLVVTCSHIYSQYSPLSKNRTGSIIDLCISLKKPNPLFTYPWVHYHGALVESYTRKDTLLSATDMRLKELWGPAGQGQHSRADYLLVGRKDQLNKTLRNSCTAGHTFKYSPTLHICQLHEDNWRCWADGGKQSLPRPLQPAGDRAGAPTAPSGRASELHSQPQARRELRHLVMSRTGQVARGTVEGILGKEGTRSTGPVWVGLSTLEETMPCSVSMPWPADETPLKGWLC